MPHNLHPAHGRIVKRSRARQPHVTGLENMVRNAPRREDIPPHLLRVWNIQDATTVSLLRARARDLRARYVRLVRVRFDNPVVPLEWFSPEGDGDTASRLRLLRTYIAAHTDSIRINLVAIRRSAMARWRLNRADRGRGNLLQRLNERNKRIDCELLWRSGRDDGDDDALANSDKSAQAQGEERALTHGVNDASVTLYPAQYLVDVQRIENQLRAEELGIVAPTTAEKRLVARTKAFEEGNWDTVLHFDESKRFRQGVKKNARQKKKLRKQAIRAYACALEARNNVPENPPSDDEHNPTA